eukprot:2451474-Rhodomonas_salina.1
MPRVLHNPSPELSELPTLFHCPRCDRDRVPEPRYGRAGEQCCFDLSRFPMNFVKLIRPIPAEANVEAQVRVTLIVREGTEPFPPESDEGQ